MRANNAHFTIHAGEAFGLPSIHEAISFCGADRLGHGVRIADDINGEQLGLVASYVRDKRTPLELCPSSNVQTGAVTSMEQHPFDLLARLRFRVTVNTDNRLMSDTTMSGEMLKLADTFGYGWADLQRFTINAMKSAFIPFPDRLRIIDDVIKPAYAVLIG
jgi:adenosine deaminase